MILTQKLHSRYCDTTFQILWYWHKTTFRILWYYFPDIVILTQNYIPHIAILHFRYCDTDSKTTFQILWYWLKNYIPDIVIPTQKLHSRYCDADAKTIFNYLWCRSNWRHASLCLKCRMITGPGERFTGGWRKLGNVIDKWKRPCHDNKHPQAMAMLEHTNKSTALILCRNTLSTSTSPHVHQSTCLDCYSFTGFCYAYDTISLQCTHQLCY